MPLRNAYRLRWQPRGLSDSLDGNNSPPGAMARLTNLIVDPRVDASWVPRPAAILKTSFPGFTTPGFISGLLVVGDIVYGVIASGRNAGHDEPFAYDAHTNAFLTVSGITAGNTPVSPPTTGDWTPPILAQVGTKIVVTHPGFPGGAIKFGWFDVSGFTSTTLTGTTAVGNSTITAMSSSPILAGWTAGMTISGTGIPAGATIVSMSGTTVTISANATAAGVATFSVTGGTVTAPQWSAGDCSVYPLPSVPVSVVQFSGRAYFACGINGVAFSDTLNATNRTNANQALLTADGLPVTALGPSMLGTQVVGGIVQGVVAFQGKNKMQQITGDYSTLNLAMNALPVATGTESPLSITPISKGLSFISEHGLRLIDFNGQVSDPIGDGGTGVSQPFIYATTPTRICSAANADVLRISVRRGDVMDNPTQEFWFDLTRKVWNGPHTFPASLVEAWRDTFIMSATDIPAKLWVSDVNPSNTTTYIENGIQLHWQYQPVLLPDDQDMHMIAIIQSSIMIAVATNQVQAQMIDDLGITRDVTMFPPDIGDPSLWDHALWDVGIWDGQGAGIYRQRAMHWHVPLVAKQLTFRLQADSAAGLRVGNLSLRYQRLGYMLEVA
jgi:hypothetical protein